MKMKKLAAMLTMATVMTGLLAGCGNSTVEEDGNTETTETTVEWDASNEITIVSREDGSGTRGAFIELVGIEEKIDGEKVDMTTEDAQTAVNYGVAHGALAMTTPGDTSMASLKEVENIVKGSGARVQR